MGPFTLVQGLMHPATPVLRLEMRLAQGAYQLRASYLFDDGQGWHLTPWVILSDDPHRIEILWQGDTGEYDPLIELWLDGIMTYADNPEFGGFGIDFVRIRRRLQNRHQYTGNAGPRRFLVLEEPDYRPTGTPRVDLARAFLDRSSSNPSSAPIRAKQRHTRFFS